MCFLKHVKGFCIFCLCFVERFVCIFVGILYIHLCKVLHRCFLKGLAGIFSRVNHVNLLYVFLRSL